MGDTKLNTAETARTLDMTDAEVKKIIDGIDSDQKEWEGRVMQGLQESIEESLTFLSVPDLLRVVSSVIEAREWDAARSGE